MEESTKHLVFLP